MMSQKQWLERILETVWQIASREYQARAWFGKGPEVSSPDEIYCTLFDDYSFDLFFEKFSPEFTQSQRIAWERLKADLDGYARITPKSLDPYKVFHDSRWQHVEQSAKDFPRAFGREPNEETN